MFIKTYQKINILMKYLYDLSKEISEQNDLSKTYPAKTKELVNLLGKQLKDYNTPMPFNKENEKQLNYPGNNN